MQKGRQRSCFLSLKTWLFEYISILDICKVKNEILILLMTLLELSALHYFYLHPNYPSLANFTLFQNYFNQVHQFYYHIVPFKTPIYSLLILSLYPFVMLVMLIVKKIGPIKPLVIVIQLAVYFYPLLSIKLVLETLSCFKSSTLIFLKLPFGLITITLGMLILYLTKRLHRYIELPIIILLFLEGNEYALMVLLGIRLALYLYIFQSYPEYMITFYYELSFYLILLSSLFCAPQINNYISFFVTTGAFVCYGLFTFRLHWIKSKTILDYAQSLNEDQESVFEILRIIEEHQTQCVFPTCKCHSYLDTDIKKMQQFIYQYQEERLRKKNLFPDRLYYSQLCAQKYDFKLSGLIRVYEHEPQSIVEQYNILKICQIFEINLRKQDKNYKYGEVYLTIHEEEQDFNAQIHAILLMIKQFWNLINFFDGSTKFLNLILKISRSINDLDDVYNTKFHKYDEEVVNLKYLMDLFRTIILNQKLNDDEQIFLAEQTTFMITSGKTVINANNNFSLLVNKELESIVGNSYYTFIPEIYREPHRLWVQQYIEDSTQYEEKYIQKYFATTNFQIQQVRMNHKILPRFMNGLEIFTDIKEINDPKKNDRQCFIMVIDKQSLFIKNVELSFFRLTKFKYSQRNIKIFMEMSIDSVFNYFNPNITHNSSQDVTLQKSFIEQFTLLSHPLREQKVSSIQKITATIQKKKMEEDMEKFSYQILKNAREEDPYLKIQFKSKKRFEKSSNIVPKVDHSSSIPKEDFSNVQDQNQKGKKEDQGATDFCLPLYIVVFFVVVHFLSLQIFSTFQTGLNTLQNRYKFYVAYDETILFAKNIYVGKNQVNKLQDLWMRGFGNYSQSINSFLWVQDPQFRNYINTNVSVAYHNNLYQQIKESSESLLNRINTLKIVLMTLTLAVLLHYLINFVLSVKYIFKIQKKVSELLMQFIVVNQADTAILQQLIDNFISKVLNFWNLEYQKNIRKPRAEGQETALELLRGNSPNTNNGLNEGTAYDFIPQSLEVGKQSINIFGSEKVSMSQIRSDLDLGKLSSKRDQEESCDFDYQYTKFLNASAFKKRYASCGFVLSANKKLFLLLTMGLVLSCAAIVLFFFFMHTPASQYQTRLEILSNLYESKIILFKSLSEIEMGHFQLQPRESISNNILSSSQKLKMLESSYFSSFKEEYATSLTGNVCLILNTSICGWQQTSYNINNYGLNIIVQQIEEYFRLKNNASIMVNNTQNTLISYSEALLDTLIQHLGDSNQRYDSQLQNQERYFIIAGSAILLLGIFLEYYSLKQFKIRIQDSKSLLKIIPEEIKQKHKQDMKQIAGDNQEEDQS